MITIEQFDNLPTEEKLQYLLLNYSFNLNLSMKIIDELVIQKNSFKQENERLIEYIKNPFVCDN